MTRGGALVVGVADLLPRAGSHREEHLEAVLPDLVVTGSRVPEGAAVEVDVRIEAVNEGVVVRGSLLAPWVGECRRCLRPVTSVLETPVLEIFEDQPVDGETRKLDVDRIDLEPVVRETVLLELPMVPLCREDCAGLCPECGADLNEQDCGHAGAVTDGRWGALDQLRFEE